MKFIVIINLLVINLIGCNSYSEEVNQIHNVPEKELKNISEEKNDNNLQLKIINDNCIATLNIKGKVVSEIYLAGSKQEEYFLPCVKDNYLKKLTTAAATNYISSLDQVTPDNNYLTITRVYKVENHTLIDDIKSSNLINGCFVNNPVTNIKTIQELLFHTERLSKQCNTDSGLSKSDENITLFNDKLKETNKFLHSNERFYIIDNKRFQEKTWYQIDNIDNKSNNKLWLDCKDIGLC